MKVVGTEDCRVVVEVEDCKVGGSHVDLLLKTIVDVRRMHSSLRLQSCPLLNSQIVDQISQIDYSVKADFCRAKHVDADNHKRVRLRDQRRQQQRQTTTQRRNEGQTQQRLEQ